MITNHTDTLNRRFISNPSLFLRLSIDNLSRSDFWRRNASRLSALSSSFHVVVSVVA